jgi:hypothetical protein
MTYQLLTDGSFGAAVGQRVGAARDLSCFIREPDDSASFYLLALSNKRMDVLNQFDEWCHAHGKPWALAFLADKYLYCGPVFKPDAADGMACFSCFYKRDLTHLELTRDPARELVIDDYFNRHADEELVGFTAGTVGMAAAFLTRAASGALEAGKLRRVDLLDGGVEDTEVFAIHQCPRCSTVTPEHQVESSYATLANAIKDLLT